MSVQARWDNPEEFQDFLEKSSRHHGDTGGLMDRLGGTMLSLTLRRIEDGDLDAENAPATQEVKQGDNPLQDTGAFQQSVRYLSTDDEVTVGSHLQHAGTLQTGATITPTEAEKLAFPASSKTRTLQRRYGFDFERLITGMRDDGWSVWFMENAVMASNPEANDDPFPLLIRKEEVTIPQYKPFQLDDEDEDDIRGVIEAWVSDVNR